MRFSPLLLRISAVGLALVMGWEGFVARPYQDEAGVWTQGYGETRGVTAASPPVTKDRAAAALRLRLDDDYKRQLARCITVPLSQNEFDALLSATYNIGGSLVCGSTLQRHANARNYGAMCAELLRWNKLRDHKTGQLRVSNGLNNRRVAEYNLCIKE